ncbi:hypothetical protein EUTSA_v10027345mg [Eutrema salsugineum]|uniref:Late embryogenesis abundant protein LEA-2 subgroup domain-containing protein n=1 Tax=Eutrema salsugineum TaxID=72664 RepID=V4MDS9_EUTSA|nr:uncharacterized protein LOC18029693 [Eutrema salsugineum]ESQ54589.1 hypothetical protein EUTSA_v10027345mg [Eutrema salsugineum]
MDEQSIAEEMKQPLLLTVTETEEVPELRSISYNDQGSESANKISRWSFLFKLFLAITTIGFFTACLSFIISITPTPPTVHVNSLHISFNDRHLPIWSSTFSIKNPNEKLSVTYENPSVWVFHRKRLVLGTVRIQSFGQRGMEESELVVKGDESGVIDEEAAREMEEEVEVTGSVVGLDMVFIGSVGFYPGTSALWGEQNMTAVCKNVRANLSTDANKVYRTKKWALSSFDGRGDCCVRLPRFP